MKRIFSILAQPKPWLCIFILWLVTILIASSFSTKLPEETPKIPHFDKIAHFGYFFGGGIILTTWLLLKRGIQTSVLIRFILPVVFFSLFGALDEYHQTFTPGRSGNDPYDWLADLLGSTLGIFLANRFHPLLLKFSSPSTSISEN